MQAEVRPYLVAVSGGVDSMVLLDMMVRAHQPIIVAHLDHGIRTTGDRDRKLVEKFARAHNLQIVSTRLELGAGTDERTAREARYAWLRSERDKHGARAIVTAHHVDDLVETILINFTRGTGWRGLSSMRATGEIVRPLLGMGLRKADVVRYAISRGLEWAEDETNDDVRYLRNYFRHGQAQKLPSDVVARLVALHNDQSRLRARIHEEAVGFVGPESPLSRYMLIMSPDAVAEELVQAWLGSREQPVTLRRVVYFAKTALPGAKLSLGPDTYITASKRELIVSGLKN